MNALHSLHLIRSELAAIDLVHWASHAAPWLIAPFLGGLLFVASTVRRMTRKAVNWIPVRARLLDCKVVVAANHIFRSRWSVHTHYRYCYEVNGQTYEGLKKWSERKDPMFSGSEHLRKIAQQGEISVFYNPRKPGDSVLRLPAQRSI